MKRRTAKRVTAATPRTKSHWRIALELVMEAIAITAILLIIYFGLLFLLVSIFEILYPYLL